MSDWDKTWDEDDLPETETDDWDEAEDTEAVDEDWDLVTEEEDDYDGGEDDY